MLVALFEDPGESSGASSGEARLILTKRPETMPNHPGQIAYDVSMNASGDFVVSWTNQRINNGLPLLEYHPYNADGSEKIGTQTVTFNPANFAGAPGFGFAWGADDNTSGSDPRVAMASNGSFVIRLVWQGSLIWVVAGHVVSLGGAAQGGRGQDGSRWRS